MIRSDAHDSVLPPAFQPDLIIYALLTSIATHSGLAVMGVTAEQYLRGVRTALIATVGHEAAFNMLQRAADAALPNSIDITPEG